MCKNCQERKVQFVNQINPEIVDLLITLKEAFNSESIALQAQQSSNGSGYYQCPHCYERTRFLDHVSGTLPFDNGEHRSWCILSKLRSQLTRLEESQPLLFAE